MKDLKVKKLIYIGAGIGLLGFVLMIIFIGLSFSGLVLFFEGPEGGIPAAISYASGNVINLVLYYVFKFKNIKKLREIRDAYIKTAEAGEPLIGGILGDGFSMLSGKLRYMRNTKRGYGQDRGDCQKAETGNNVAEVELGYFQVTLAGPTFILFIFSIPSLFKLSGIKNFESKNNLNK